MITAMQQLPDRGRFLSEESLQELKRNFCSNRVQKLKGVVMITTGSDVASVSGLAVEKFNPSSVAPPIVPEYSHVAVVPPGMRMLYLAGQLGIRADGSIPASFDDQLIQAYENVRLILESQGATPRDIARISVFAVGEPVDRQRLKAFRAEYFAGALHPPSVFVFVPRLARPDFLVEVAVEAAVPPGQS